MATKTVRARCPFCGSGKVTKNGHNRTGKQVYRCNNPACQRKSFVEEYTYKACEPEVRRQVLKLAVDCTGTRATGRRLVRKTLRFSKLHRMHDIVVGLVFNCSLFGRAFPFHLI